MVSVIEARRIIEGRIPPLREEKIKLSVAAGRILAANVKAPFPMPRFDNSAMDGFAVRAEDTEGATQINPVELKSIGVIPAGSSGDLKLKPGQCAQVMTGAVIPSGADAVIMVENTSGFDESGIVRIFTTVQPGDHIRRQGEEISQGAVLIRRGTPITTAEIGVLATFGYASVSVTVPVRVAIFTTGDELQEPGTELKSGQIYNSNLPVISDLVQRAGSRIIIQRLLRDDQNELKVALQEALETADVVISTGGISMGRFDFLRLILKELSVKEHFWKVAQKPGKPLYFGSRGKTLVFSLPGNPVSAFIGFMVWVWPVLEKMQGKQPNHFLEAVLTRPFPREETKYRFLFGKVEVNKGKLVCRPAEKIGSHMLSSALEANCILEVEPGKGQLPVGSKIIVQILPWKSIV